MKVKELIEKLEELEGNRDVLVLNENGYAVKTIEMYYDERDSSVLLMP